VRKKTQYTATISDQRKHKKIQKVFTFKTQTDTELKITNNNNKIEMKEMRIKLLLASYLKEKGVTAFYSFLPLSSCLSPFSLNSTALSPLLYPFFPHTKHLTEVLKMKSKRMKQMVMQSTNLQKPNRKRSKIFKRNSTKN